MKGGKSKAASSTKADSKLSVKKGGAVSKKGKGVAKDPNKPKRPPSAFFVFMEEFRVEYKQKNPNNKSVANVGKAAGEKWKSMSDAEKAPYIKKADKRKAEYEKTMNTYNKKLSEGNKHDEEEDADEESDKSKSEVHDDDDEDDDDEGSDEDEEDDD